ncbi:MAG: preprotein translocase subunit SecG [Candidatus Saccharimonadales bacterium]
MPLNEMLRVITVVSGIIMVLFILLQARGATLGAGFGSSGELYTTRRGLDKSLYEATIILSVLFVMSIIASLLIG